MENRHSVARHGVLVRQLRAAKERAERGYPRFEPVKVGAVRFCREVYPPRARLNRRNVLFSSSENIPLEP